MRQDSRSHHLEAMSCRSTSMLVPNALRSCVEMSNNRNGHCARCGRNGLKQELLDEWFATPPSSRTTCRPFVVWASNTGRSELKVGQRKASHQPTMTQDERIEAAANCLSESTGPILARCAALLALLYAQPLTRIVQLHSSALDVTPTSVTIVLSSDPVPIPPPFDRVFRGLSDDRLGRNLYNRNSEFMFPGYKAGHPRTVDSLRTLSLIHI